MTYFLAFAVTVTLVIVFLHWYSYRCGKLGLLATRGYRGNGVATRQGGTPGALRLTTAGRHRALVTDPGQERTLCAEDAVSRWHHARALRVGMVAPALVPLASVGIDGEASTHETHGGEGVVLYGIGNGSGCVRGVLEQDRLFEIITAAFG